MNYLDAITRIATGIGSVGILIGLLIAFKSGLLAFVWNLKKNGNGKDSHNEIANAIIAVNKRIENLSENHFTHLAESIKELKDDMKEIRRDISNHAEQDARVQVENVRVQGEILAIMKK